jgi:hypothetical protein
MRVRAQPLRALAGLLPTLSPWGPIPTLPFPDTPWEIAHLGAGAFLAVAALTAVALAEVLPFVRWDPLPPVASRTAWIPTSLHPSQ